jgi:hypothetical protein
MPLRTPAEGGQGHAEVLADIDSEAGRSRSLDQFRLVSVETQLYVLVRGRVEDGKTRIRGIHVQVDVRWGERSEEPQRELLQVTVLEDMKEPSEVTTSLLTQRACTKWSQAPANRVEMLVEGFRCP